MTTTFADGTTIAALRWAGPPVSIPTHHGALARRGEEVIFARWGELMRLSNPFDGWPLEVGAPEDFRARDNQDQVATTTAALLESGDVLCVKQRYGDPMGVVRWRPGDAAKPLRVFAACFEVAPDGGLYTVSPAPSAFVIEHRATTSLEEAPRELGRLKYTKKSDCRACTAALADGSLLVLLHTGDGLGGPVGLYRARAGVAGDGALEAVQAVRHVSIVRDADAPKKPAKAAPRSDVVALGRINFLVPSPRGVWLVTGGGPPTQPGAQPPIHVYELIGDALALARPPFSLPVEQFDYLRGACAVGDLLAIATNGAVARITLTDGVASLRVEGTMGRMSDGGGMASLIGSPRGDAVLLAFGFGFARCELVRDGDPRLAEPAYDEPPPPAAPPEPPPRPPLRRDTWLFRIRLQHIIATISALNLDDPHKAHGFEGDATSGRAYEHDGSGNYIAAMWSEAGVVVLGYDDDGARLLRGELRKELPSRLTALGEKAHAWLKRSLTFPNASRPPSATDVAWFSVAEDRGGKRSNTDRLRKLLAEEAEMLAAWSEYYGISARQLGLARALAAAPARHLLTDDEVATLRAKPASNREVRGAAPPGGQAAAEDAQLERAVQALVASGRFANEEEARGKLVRIGPQTEAAEALGRRQLRDAGIDWPVK